MYIKRNDSGEIIAISQTEEVGFELADENSDDFQLFLTNLPKPTRTKYKKLLTSDAELARVLEDLIDLLTDKGVVQFTELPEAAQVKLLKRKTIRKNAPLLNLFNEQDDDSILL